MVFSHTPKTGVKQPLGPRAPRWADLVATVCHLGHVTPGPGTWGSVIGVIVWLLATSAVTAPLRSIAVFGVAVVLTAVGIRAATLLARAAGEADPPYVIVDEVAGQLFTLIGTPITWKSAVVGFLLFRFFDITKPFPLRRLEDQREGIGIVMDDVGAGIYSLAILQVLLHFGILN